ncbi:MAG: hypothetical protein JW955_03695 [Sedimentisphaerales bacterium]|nr:hypothetical protein [Sedimentisphaerales bacterium]
MKTARQFAVVTAGMFLMAAGTSGVRAESVCIPNGSFESPPTVFVDVNTAPWQKGPTPAWYDESRGYTWSQLTGVFLNVPPEDEEHIDNCDGKQAVWLFAVPEVELYQDLAATFEVGQCYHLSVGVIGGGGNMKDGVSLEIRLYYRDADDMRVTVESTTFTYHSAHGYIKHFNDVRLDLPVVQQTDPWAGKKIGVQIISALTLADLDPATGRAGGYWDLDNVRLTRSLPGPTVPISVPNASFELPETVFVDVNIDSWQKGLKPLWYEESGGYTWAQLTGVFLNVPPEDQEHIDNCDGKQAAWLFAVPEVELHQDLAATFEVGQGYHLSVGAIGGGGNMKNGVPLGIRLYYRDANDVRVTIETTTVTYDAAKGYVKHFGDVRLDLPAVQETDPWAGKNIGVQIISTLTLADLDPTTGRAGGYWDLDNVRLSQSLPPEGSAPTN